MAVIAFISYNMVIACVYGAYSLLIAPIEAKLGVTRELSSLGIPLVLLSSALVAPVGGILAEKVSIRLLMTAGALMLAAGFVVAAMAGSIVAILAAYGLLVGPGLCLAGTILPPTLVTRWYNVNRGRALGLVNMPLLSVCMPPVFALVLRGYGVSGVYFMLAGLMAMVVVPLLFVVDHPPRVSDKRGAIDPTGEDVAAVAAADPGMSVGALLGTGRFWTLSLGYAVIMVGATILAGHLVPMVVGWGVDETRASGLIVASSAGGMVGSVLFGWIADRIGGAKTLAILCFNGAILWALLLLQPPFAVTMVIAALMGVHGGPVVADLWHGALAARFRTSKFWTCFGPGYHGEPAPPGVGRAHRRACVRADRLLCGGGDRAGRNYAGGGSGQRDGPERKAAAGGSNRPASREHVPEKWVPVFRSEHALNIKLESFPAR